MSENKSLNKFPTPDDRWVVTEAYFREKGLVRQHLDSYNDFVGRVLKEIIGEYCEIPVPTINGKIVIDDLRIDKPKIREVEGYEEEVTPMECRLRNLTYASPTYLRFHIEIEGEYFGPHEILLMHLPIMLRSYIDPLSRKPGESEEEYVKRLTEAREDPRDPGGYFIINGSERVLVAQEDLASNNVLVDKASEGSAVTHIAKVISVARGRRSQLVIERRKDGILYASFQGIRVPFVVLMRALGLEKDEDIVYAISLDPEIQKELLPSLVKAASIRKVDDALDFIGSRIAIGQPKPLRIERAKLMLTEYMLPHITATQEDAEELSKILGRQVTVDEAKRLLKAFFIGQMACKLLELVKGWRKPDDKDHYRNKRLKLAGELLAQLLRYNLANYFIRELKNAIEKNWSKHRRADIIKSVLKPGMLTDRILHAMATGNWPGGKTGVSQLLDRTNLMSSLSHLRRVVSPLARSQPHFEARELHPTQWGRICPFESPEGQNIGLVKNLALMANVSVGVPEEEVRHVLRRLGVVPISKVIELAKKKGSETLLGWSRVYLNGRLIGYHSDGSRLAHEIRRMRRRGELSPEVNVAHLVTKHTNEVFVNTDAGRIRRLLFVVENGELRLKPEHIKKLKEGKWSFSDLVVNGIVEFLDADEEENALIALNPEEITLEHTHMEVWTPSILGITASLIPYAEHNQSPRNTYEAAMAKQALGLYAANFQHRSDSRGHFLHYPQKPLVQTRVMDIIGFNDRPAGQNMVVAVMSFTGYNIEDALIMNKSAVDRGLGRSTFFRLYATTEYKYPGGQEDVIEIPQSHVKGYRGPKAYDKLEEDGIVVPETKVKGGDVLIGKTSPPRFLTVQEYGVGASLVRQDTSIVTRHGEKGVVDTVLMTTDSEGNKLVKVRVRDLRIPELGDKFASRHGQKGVIGLLIPQEDLPFTEEGIVPDLIINPHAFPSRMTVGQLIESIAGKVAALEGRFVDATPFYKEPVEKIKITLRRLGYPDTGEEAMYDGRTGELLLNPIFIGIVYYQKLHHMVSDKIHARARGPVQILTRQPVEGRARMGGLRWGEMERDCLVGHGAAMLLKEQLLDKSDRTIIYVCDICGHIGWYDRSKGKYVCPVHGDRGKLYPVEVSYAFKLLLQELMSMCIMPRLRLEDIVKKK